MVKVAQEFQKKLYEEKSEGIIFLLRKQEELDHCLQTPGVLLKGVKELRDRLSTKKQKLWGDKFWLQMRKTFLLIKVIQGYSWLS